MQAPSVVVTLNRANTIVFKCFNAGLRISPAINYITSANNAIDPGLSQIVDSCFESLIFGVNVTDNTNSPISHQRNHWGWKVSSLPCSEIIDDKCAGIIDPYKACLKPENERYSDS